MYSIKIFAALFLNRMYIYFDLFLYLDPARPLHRDQDEIVRNPTSTDARTSTGRSSSETTRCRAWRSKHTHPTTPNEHNFDSVRATHIRVLRVLGAAPIP